jgi:hypothetical protein
MTQRPQREQNDPKDKNSKLGGKGAETKNTRERHCGAEMRTPRLDMPTQDTTSKKQTTKIHE